eukprot:360881-Chlamydomonas_euryale.AAC.1
MDQPKQRLQWTCQSNICNDPAQATCAMIQPAQHVQWTGGRETIFIRRRSPRHVAVVNEVHHIGGACRDGGVPALIRQGASNGLRQLASRRWCGRRRGRRAQAAQAGEGRRRNRCGRRGIVKAEQVGDWGSIGRRLWRNGRVHGCTAADPVAACVPCGSAHQRVGQVQGRRLGHNSPLRRRLLLLQRWRRSWHAGSGRRS